MIRRFATVAAVAVALTTVGGPVSFAQSPLGDLGDFGANKETLGTLLGAGGGALLGSQIGKGSGKLAATAAGTLLGAVLGHQLASQLGPSDQAAAQQAERNAYEAPIGHTIRWNNDSGNSGTITPVREGQDDQGRYCREFQQTIVIDGQRQRGVGRACRQSDGTWQVVS